MSSHAVQIRDSQWFQEKTAYGASKNNEKEEAGAEAKAAPTPGPLNLVHETDEEYCIFSKGTKIWLVIFGSVAAFLSPVSGLSYFPALDSIGADLRVSRQMMDLTVTVFMIFQGAAPSFMSSLTDVYGRRPCYFAALVLFVASGVGTALQTNYPLLVVLRCLQSSGSSAFILLGSSVIADISTTANRGSYNAYGYTAALLGPTFGPAIGGAITHFLGWRALFWFLAIFGGVLWIALVLFVPETGRDIVGNGSVPPQRWNRPLLLRPAGRRASRGRRDSSSTPTLAVPGGRDGGSDSSGSKRETAALHFSNPLTTLLLVADRRTGPSILYASLSYSAYYFAITSITLLFPRTYHYDELRVGLSFIPLGLGCVASTLVVGRLADANYRRLAIRHGRDLTHRRQIPLGRFPIETARLQVALPLAYAAAVAVTVYGWTLERGVPVAGPFAALVVLGFANAGTVNIISTLSIDVYAHVSSSRAIAAMNLCKCALGATMVAVASRMVDALGVGWSCTVISLVLIVGTVPMWLAVVYGPQWREEAEG